MITDTSLELPIDIITIGITISNNEIEEKVAEKFLLVDVLEISALFFFDKDKTKIFLKCGTSFLININYHELIKRIKEVIR